MSIQQTSKNLLAALHLDGGTVLLNKSVSKIYRPPNNNKLVDATNSYRPPKLPYQLKIYRASSRVSTNTLSNIASQTRNPTTLHEPQSALKHVNWRAHVKQSHATNSSHPSKNKPLYYHIAKGDNLWNISHHCKSNIPQLLDDNSQYAAHPERIHPGNRLLIRNGTPGATCQLHSPSVSTRTPEILPKESTNFMATKVIHKFGMTYRLLKTSMDSKVNTAAQNRNAKSPIQRSAFAYKSQALIGNAKLLKNDVLKTLTPNGVFLGGRTAVPGGDVLAGAIISSEVSGSKIGKPSLKGFFKVGIFDKGYVATVDGLFDDQAKHVAVDAGRALSVPKSIEQSIKKAGGIPFLNARLGANSEGDSVASACYGALWESKQATTIFKDSIRNVHNAVRTYKRAAQAETGAVAAIAAPETAGLSLAAGAAAIASQEALGQGSSFALRKLEENAKGLWGPVYCASVTAKTKEGALSALQGRFHHHGLELDVGSFAKLETHSVDTKVYMPQYRKEETSLGGQSRDLV